MVIHDSIWPSFHLLCYKKVSFACITCCQHCPRFKSLCNTGNIFVNVIPTGHLTLQLKYLFKIKALYWIRNRSSTWPNSIVLCIHVLVSLETSSISVLPRVTDNHPHTCRNNIWKYNSQLLWDSGWLGQAPILLSPPSSWFNNLSHLPSVYKQCQEFIRSVSYPINYVLLTSTIQLMKSETQTRKLENVFLQSCIIPFMHKIKYFQANSSLSFNFFPFDLTCIL